jgi:hypothetical protein
MPLASIGRFKAPEGRYELRHQRTGGLQFHYQVQRSSSLQADARTQLLKAGLTPGKHAVLAVGAIVYDVWLVSSAQMVWHAFHAASRYAGA